MEFLLNYQGLILTLALIALGYWAGRVAEKKHYQSIQRREKALLHLPVVSGEEEFVPEQIADAQLVRGSVVISNDYFKRFLAGLRIFFGGRISSYESLVDRARREAILRMKEQAHQCGAQIIVNLRLETSTIGNNANQKGGIGSIEVIAYGTAIRSPS